MTNHNLWLLTLLALATSFPTSFSFVSNSNGHQRRQCFQCKSPFSYRWSEPNPIALGMILENVKNSNENDQLLVNITPLLEMTSPSPKRETLKDRTRRLLKTTDPWNEECFEEAQAIMKSWSLRQSRKAATTVERIIRRIVQEQKAGNAHVEECLDMATMYTQAIQGWANSWEKGAAAHRAEEILDTMQRRYMDGDDRIQPGIECFNLVLLAYARSGLPDAPQQALRVLEKLHQWYSDGSTDVRSDVTSYATVLRAFANSGKPDAPEQVKRLLEHLEQLADKEIYSGVRPNYLCHGAYICALVDALDRDHITGAEAAEKAEAYLYQMLNSPYEDVHPDSWCFNMVLNAWSRSYSPLEMVERAEAVMEEFENYHERCGRTEKTRPNTNSYNSLIACYSRSHLPDKGEKAHAVLRKLQALVDSGNNTSAYPDVITYNTVMTAYTRSKQQDAPYKVEQLLREMHELFEETEDMRVRPNIRSFNTCVNSWAKSNLPGAASRIMDWIVHMQANAEKQGRRSIRPNKWTFGAFLQALSKSGEPTMGEEAEAILDHLVENYDKGWIELKPDVLTFTSVIHCIAVSGREDALERSLAIVRRMEDMFEKGYGDVRPNTYTYNCIINAAAKSKRPGKAQIAMEILRRMQDVALRPLTVTYNNVLNACAFSNHPEDHRGEILDIAKLAFEEAKSTCGANYITYSGYIRVLGTFVDDIPKRVRMIEEIFHQCCEAGQLSKAVLTQLKFAVPAKQFAELRAEVTDEKTGRLRDEYTINARMATMLPPAKSGIPQPPMPQ